MIHCHRRRLFAVLAGALIAWLPTSVGRHAGVGAQSATTSERPELLVQSSHAERITKLVFSPDLTYLATGSVDGTVKLWNLKLGRLVRTLPVSRYWVYTLAFAPDSAVLAVGAGDNTITLWDLRSWRLVSKLQGHAHAVTSVAFSPDGRLLASSSRVDQNDPVSPMVAIWDARSGQRLRALRSGPGGVRSVAFLDATHVVTVDGAFMTRTASLTVWDATTGAALRQLSQPSFDVREVAFARTGPVAVIDGFRYTTPTTGIKATIVWDLRRDSPTRMLDTQPLPIAAMPASDSYVVWYGDRVESYDLDGRMQVVLSAPPRDWKPPFAISDGGTQIAGIRADGSICVQPLLSGVSQCLNSAFEAVRRVAFSPKGDELAVGLQSGAINLIDLARGQPRAQRRKHQKAIESLEFDSRGERLLAASVDAVSAWDVRTDDYRIDPDSLAHQSIKGGSVATDTSMTSYESRQEISPPQVPAAPRGLSIDNSPVFRSIFSGALSADGAIGAIGGYKNFVQLWDLKTGASADLFESAAAGPASAGVTALEFSPDGRWLATGDETGVLAVFDLRTRTRTMPASRHRRAITAIAFSPTTPGEFVSSAVDGSLLLSDATSDGGRDIRAHETSALSLAYTPDGKRVITGGADGEIRVWSIPELIQLGSTQAQTSAVNTIGVSPDGRLIVTGGEDATVTFRRADTLQALVTLVTSNTRDWLAFSPEGFFDGTERAWERAVFRFGSDPDRLYEPQQFFNVFFEPGLLSTIVREAAAIPDVLRRSNDPRALSDLDTLRRSALPRVSITGPANGGGGRTAVVQIAVEDGGSGMQDLRVFRNRSLVYAVPGKLAPQGATRTFRVPITITLTTGFNEISAYAFNADNVRANDARVSLRGVTNVQAGRVFVFGIGIDSYASGQNLKYAAADVSTAVESLQTRANQVRARVFTSQLSNETATAANVKRGLLRLAGADAADTALPRGLERLQRAQPEDAVILYYAGHGMVDGDRYFMLTHEYQPAPDGRITEGMPGTISDRELDDVLRRIDASRILLVLDSCFSGKVLDAAESRRGPWNQRGLAQLAYEKGMYLLAAAQSYETAAEVSQLGHGLLTYALINEGLGQLKADRDPKDGTMSVAEWLDFAAETIAAMSTARAAGSGVESTPRLIGRQRPTALQHAQTFYPRDAYEQPWIVVNR